MTKIAIKDILPNPDQPRTVFDQAELKGLAQSIQKNTLIQPIVVEFVDGKYILVDGERRFRACKMLGMTEIDAVVNTAMKKKCKARLMRALIANVQRSSMGPVDEAKAYEQLVKELGSVEAVVEEVGVSDASVYSKLMLLDFPPPVQQIFNTKNISVDPKMIARMKKLSTEQQVEVANIAATRGLSAKAVMLLCARITKGKKDAYVVKTRQAVEPEPVAGGHFNALALVKRWKELPKEVITTAKRTCRDCPLYSFANANTCRQCALPTFLNNHVSPEATT